MSEYNLDEPTMEEKLATLNLINREHGMSDTEKQSLSMAPPSADSVHILLKQALRADDNVALLTCLYNRDEKVLFSVLSLVKASSPSGSYPLLVVFFFSQRRRRAAHHCIKEINIICWLYCPSNLK